MQPLTQSGSKDPSIPEVLTVQGPGGHKDVKIEERDVAVPLIDLSLYPLYRLGDLIEAGPEYGTQMEARLSYVWEDSVRELVGAAVPVDLHEPKIVVPLGFFTRAH